MAPRTPAGIRARLNRAGLLPLAMSDACTVAVKVSDNQLHASFCRHRPAKTTGEVLPLSQLLAGDITDADCLLSELGHLNNVSISGHYGVLANLIRGSETARAASRLAKQAIPAPGAVTRMLNQANRTRNEMACAARTTSLAAGDRSRILEELGAAIAELHNPAPVRNEARCAAVAARVRHDLVPRAYRSRIRLDDSLTLIGIAPHRGTTAAVNDVLRTFAIGRPRQGLVTLLAPRFVADYLNRYYATGNNWATVIQAVPTEGLDETLVETATQLWDPLSDVPLADLKTAVTVAGQVMNSNADGTPAADDQAVA